MSSSAIRVWTRVWMCCKVSVDWKSAIEMQVQLPQTMFVCSLFFSSLHVCAAAPAGYIPDKFCRVMTVAANAALSHWPQAEVQRWRAGETDSIRSNSTPTHCGFFCPQIQLMLTQVWHMLSHTLSSSLWAHKKLNCTIVFSHMQDAVSKVWLKIFSAYGEQFLNNLFDKEFWGLLLKQSRHRWTTRHSIFIW